MDAGWSVQLSSGYRARRHLAAPPKNGGAAAPRCDGFIISPYDGREKPSVSRRFPWNQCVNLKDQRFFWHKFMCYFSAILLLGHDREEDATEWKWAPFCQEANLQGDPKISQADAPKPTKWCPVRPLGMHRWHRRYWDAKAHFWAFCGGHQWLVHLQFTMCFSKTVGSIKLPLWVMIAMMIIKIPNILGIVFGKTLKPMVFGECKTYIARKIDCVS